MFYEKLSLAGEHPFIFSGATGKLEGILTIPETQNINPPATIAILGHPHSLHGGTMQNKVVTTMAKAFREKNIPSLRFNFRGVGNSEGHYDAGLGESEDMVILTKQWLQEMPDTGVIFAGFSFGSYVTYRAAAQMKHQLLLSIAPAVHHYDYQEFPQNPHPWFIIQGDLDEVVAAKTVSQFAENVQPPIPVIHMPEASHFFHGKLLELKAHIQQLI